MTVFGYNKSGTLGTGAMQFMRQHGVLKEHHPYAAGKEYDDGSFQSAKPNAHKCARPRHRGFAAGHHALCTADYRV